MQYSNKIKTSLIAISCLLLYTRPLIAQQYNWIASDLGKVKAAYKDAGYLSYSIQYSYTSKKAGGKVTDSLLIVCKSHNKYYYTKIGPAEFMQNSQYNLAVHHQTKSIIIGNPVAAEHGLASVINIDSAFLQNHVDSVLVKENKESKIIRLLFDTTSRFIFYTITFNKKNYLIEKINYCIKQPDEEGNEGDTDEITFNMLFSKYDRNSFDDSFFSEKGYVIKNTSGDFTGKGEYSAYQIRNIKGN
jgi:hypothetical protein